MSGYKGFNFDLFDKVEECLVRTYGWEVINPVKSDSPDLQRLCRSSECGDLKELPHGTWEEVLGLDVATLLEEAGTLVLLPGWNRSRGARLEAFAAMTVNMPIMLWDDQHEKVRPLPFTTCLGMLTEGITRDRKEYLEQVEWENVT